ncbi:MAG: hypothetical protein RBS40_08515 [Rhodocyclaceae bacterium]|jgi:hypothetical protein|nr:hypothetical protein [Rhodocyclaceae bacterium]
MAAHRLSRFPVAVALGLVVLILALSPLAQAGDGRGAQAAEKLKARFLAADANGDGRLTKAEAEGRMPFVHRNFEKIDTAGQGAVSLADLEGFAARALAERKGGTP